MKEFKLEERRGKKRGRAEKRPHPMDEAFERHLE